MFIWSARAAAVLALVAAIVLPPVFALSSPAAAEPVPPRLAVLVVFDQLRGDYPERWVELYGPGGFRRLEEGGAWFQNCHYSYADTVTGAGHASVATGCTPDTHGIIANEWYDQAVKAEVNCVESERYPRVPPVPREEPADPAKKAKKYTGVAPDRLLAPTLADALKEATGGRARVVSLSFKDRGAVLPGGQHPDACYWFDANDGLFVTSTWYRDRVHPWVADFNAGRAVDRWSGQEWTRLRPDLDYAKYSGPDAMAGEGKGSFQGVEFPHPFDGGPKKLKKDYYAALYNSPFGNELLLELAGRAIDAEKLGTHDVPDLLCLSFSCNDPIGHTWGPDSQEVLDVTLRTDRIIKGLLAALDAKVGRGRYVLALSADHGVCPLPEVARAEHHDASRVPATLLTVKADEFLVTKFGGDAKTHYVTKAIHPWVYLNHELLKARNLDAGDVEAALAEWLARQEGIQAAYTRSQLVAGVAEDDRVGQMMRRSFHPDRAGDVGVVMKPYSIMWSLTGTTHGSPHPYDTYVPLMVYGAGVRPGVHKELVQPQAGVPILARALGIKPPTNASEAVPEGVFGK
jgi:predicted AlkP superfamily pyrophosphatase or phosphodiesterase